jgi:hypothetical protein
VHSEWEASSTASAHRQQPQTNKLGFSVLKFLIFAGQNLELVAIVLLWAEEQLGSLQQPQLNTAASEEHQL